MVFLFPECRVDGVTPAREAGDAGVGSGAAVPDLGEQPGGAQRLGAGQGQEDVGVGVVAQQGGNVRVEGVDLGDQCGQRGHERAGRRGVVTDDPARSYGVPGN